MRAALPLSFAFLLPLAGCGTAPPQSPAGAARTQELPWIRDDAPRAVAEAKRSGKPLFVEFGADWCKACVSMGNYAFKDPTLVEALRDRAVWLSIDIENPANAAFVEAHRHKHYPTFTVIAGSGEQSWTGYFQADEFVKIFRVALLGDAGALQQQELRYEEKYRLCADAAPTPADDPWVELAATTTAATTTAATCVQALVWKGESTPDTVEVRNRLQAALDGALGSGAPATPDGPLFVHEAYEALFVASDGEARGTVGAAWRRYAERLPVVPRAHAYRVSGSAGVAAKFLEEYTKTNGEEFSVYQELAETYRVLGRFDAGLPASDRALALGRGPALLPVYLTKAFLAHRAGDEPLAERTLDEGKALALRLPLSRGGADVANRLARIRDYGF
jgi:thiol-disulfide isomerase/thioredoxin